jgi:ABC-type transport system involved in multi-copper enzyme maturation permease subunit
MATGTRTWTAAARDAGLGPVLAAVLLLGSFAFLCVLLLSVPLPGWAVFSFWAAWLLGLAVASGPAVGNFLGPVFFFDMLRSSRRGRHFGLRCAYGVLLLCTLFVAYSSWFRVGLDPHGLFVEETIPATEMSKFGTSFYLKFLCVQFLVMLLLTPLYTAGAIAEEKDKRTLDYLLTTHLSSREIVLSKLLARLGHLALLLLVGLPIVGLTQFFGGVDPALVLAGFAATFATMLSLGGLSILISVHSKHPLQATLRTYAYAALALLVTSCVPGLNLANPAWALYLLTNAWAETGSQGTLLAGILGAYLVLHLVAGVICIIIAVSALRRAAQGQEPSLRMQVQQGTLVVWMDSLGGHTDFSPGLLQPRGEMHPDQLPEAPPPEAEPKSTAPGPPVLPRPPWQPTPAVLPLPRPRPRIGDDALLWKEMYLEQEFQWERLNPALAIFLLFVGVCACSVGLTIIIVALATQGSPAVAVNVWLRCVGTPLVCLMCVIIAFYASASVSRERERQTLDNLLTTPDGAEAVLKAKWLGSMLSVRHCFWCLGVVYGLGLLSGGLHPLAVPLLALAYLVYTAFVASLGVYFSTVSATTLRATVFTVMFLVALCGLQAMLWGNLEPLLADNVLPGWLSALPPIQEYGLTPPVPLLVLSFPLFGRHLDRDFDFTTPATLASALAGLAVYALAAWVLWRMALTRFRAQTR